MKSREILASLAISNKGNWNDIYQSLMKKEYHDKNKFFITENYVSILDNNYPEKLKQIYKPPFVLFYEGNLSLLNNNDLIAIGADSLWDYSWDKLSDLLDFSGNHHYIFDGTKPIAKGLAQSLKNFIVVVNCGIDEIDKDLMAIIHKNNGLIITEFPSGVKNGEGQYRIISALEERLVVVHCENRGFAIMQITNSLNLGHKVYVMPTPLDSVKETRNNELIAEGALCFYTKLQLTE